MTTTLSRSDCLDRANAKRTQFQPAQRYTAFQARVCLTEENWAWIRRLIDELGAPAAWERVNRVLEQGQAA